MNIHEFTLVGHSLGGYIGGHYALNYPDRVDKLILLSSAGVTRLTEEDIKKQIDDSPFHYKLLIHAFDYIWQNQITFSK